MKLTQDITGGRTVGIDTFVDQDSTSVPVYWPGGVAPVINGGGSQTDIYSFKIFDGAALKADPAANTIFGVVGGQNYS